MTSPTVVAFGAGIGNFAILAALTDNVLISVIGSTATLLGIVSVSYFTYRTSRFTKETHEAVNSRMTEFMELAKKSFKAEGVLQGVADEKSQQLMKEVAKAEGVIEEKARQEDKPGETLASIDATTKTIDATTKTIDATVKRKWA